MKASGMAMLALFVLFAAESMASATGKDHPVSKIINLLKGLSEKSETEHKEEEQAYVKFEYWCTNSKKSLNKAIAKEKEEIEELRSQIESLELQEEQLTKSIAELAEELAELDKADAKAKFDRGEDAKLFKIADDDYTGTIKAIDDAITELETAETNTDTGLLQAQTKVKKALALSSAVADEHQKAVLSAFVQQGSSGAAPAPAPRPDFIARGDYAAHVKQYSFKSNSVIELLKELKKKFEDDKLATVKAETNAINAYDLAKAAREDMRTATKKSKKAKEDELSDVQSDLSTARGDLKSVLGDLKDDSKSLEQTESSCSLKKTEWEERSVVRENEQAAIAAAIKILSKGTGVRTEAPSNPVPPPSPVLLSKGQRALSLLQLQDPVSKAIKVLRSAAQAEHSKALDLLAQQISASGDGHFDKVINMIEKMIFRLMDEQKNEDTHKLWCDKELSKTNSSLVNKEEKIADLNAKIDDAKAREKVLTKEISDDNDMIAQIVAHVKEAKEIRAIGKKENALAVQDAKDAQETIANAIAVLEEFYKDSGKVPKEDWEFMQQPVTLPAKPATWSSSYTGVADPMDQPAGIITVMKKISSDFGTMEADTLAQEATDQSAFEDDMKACSIEKAGREKGVEMKTNEKKRLTGKIAELSSVLKEVSDEHAATEQYLADLQPACVDGSSTYEARKSARSKEIEALRQAQNILQNAFNAPAAAPGAAALQLSFAPAPSPSFLQQKRR